MMSVPRLLALTRVFYLHIFNHVSCPETFGSPMLQSDCTIDPLPVGYGGQPQFFFRLFFFDALWRKRKVVAVRMDPFGFAYVKDPVSAVAHRINIKLFNPISTYGRLSNMMSGVQHIMLKLLSSVTVYTLLSRFS